MWKTYVKVHSVLLYLKTGIQNAASNLKNEVLHLPSKETSARLKNRLIGRRFAYSGV